MGFNWGAFSGGLAEGIEKGNEIAMKNRQLQATIEQNNNEATRKLQEAKAKDIDRVSTAISKYNEKLLDYDEKISNAKDLDNANALIDGLNRFKENSKKYFKSVYNMTTTDDAKGLLASVNTDASAKLTNYTIKDVRGNNTTVILPEGIDEQRINNIRLMDNGNIGEITIDNTTGKTNGVQPTNMVPIKFKAEKVDGEIAIVDGKSGFYTKDDLAKFTQEGKTIEKPVTSTNKVDVKVDASNKSAEISNEGIRLLDKSKTQKLSSDEVNTLWSTERDFLKNQATTEEKKMYADIESKNNTIKQLSKTKQVMEKMVAAGIDGGIAQDIIVGTMKYTGSGGRLSDLSGITPEKFKQITGVEANLTSQQMQIIKDLSGLSYTDRQMDMMGQITGNKSFATNESKINAMNGYIDGIKSEISDLTSSDDRFARKFPHLSYSLGLGGHSDSKTTTPVVPSNNTSNKKSLKDFGF